MGKDSGFQILILGVWISHLTFSEKVTLKACMRGNIEIFQLLIKNVTEKMPIDGGGRTPLHHSVISGHFDVTKALIDYLKVTKNSFIT